MIQQKQKKLAASNIVTIFSILSFFCSCHSKIRSTEEYSNGPMAIGYKSYPINIGDKKSKIDSFLNLKASIDNDTRYPLINFSCSSLDEQFGSIKANVSLFFTFKTTDSTLVKFTAALLFVGSKSEEILPKLKNDLSEKIPPCVKLIDNTFLKSKKQIQRLGKYNIQVEITDEVLWPIFSYSIFLEY